MPARSSEDPTNDGTLQPASGGSLDLDELADRTRSAVLRLARELRLQNLGGLGTTETFALIAVWESGSLTVGELAARERVSQPTMSNVVARLQQKGLVIREKDRTDRRVWKVFITNEGRRRLAANKLGRTEWLSEQLSQLSEEETAHLAQTLYLIDQLAGRRRPLDGD